MSQQVQSAEVPKRELLTPIMRLQARVQELLSQVKEDRLRAGRKVVSLEAPGQLLVLQAREVALDDVLAEIEMIQNGSEDPNKVLDFLGADDLPSYHDSAWVED
mgnify:CR=1 FL=1